MIRFDKMKNHIIKDSTINTQPAHDCSTIIYDSIHGNQ